MSTPDPTLPFFAYGIFAPGQISFFQIKNSIRRIENASASGVLRIRDGVPVLDANQKDGVVDGFRITFTDAAADVAYQAIQDMEPSNQYRWVTEDETNILVGSRPQRGSSPMVFAAGGNLDWSSWRDAAFNDALDVVDENLAMEFVWDDLRPFYRLQGAHMVLWSSIERYVSLRYGLGRNERVLERIKRLAKEETFEISLRATERAALPPKMRRLYRADDPRTVLTFDPNGPPERALEYLYQVRSNVAHRGKAQPLDWDLLHAATAETLRIFREVLQAAERDAQWTVGISGR